MIPFLILDVDGTLVDSTGNVQPCVWEAIEEARGAGIRIALCTGRPGLGVALKIAQRVGPNNPHIFQNGAHLAYCNGENLQVRALREANAMSLIDHAREIGAVLELYTPSNLFVERRTPMSEAHAKTIGVSAIVRDLSDVAAHEPVVRAQWVVEDDLLAAVLGFELDGVQTSHATSPVLPSAHFVSVTRAGVDKGSAVRELAKTLNLNLANVMAVGDSQGDRSMLEAVGHPVVMANADPDLVARFELRAGDVESCGVVEAIELARELKTV